MRNALIVTTAIIAVALSSQARATLALEVLDNGVAVTGTTLVGPGSISFTSTVDPDFASITVSGAGFPSEPNPDLSMVQLAAKTSAIGGGHTLMVELTQTEPNAFPGGATQTTYTYNGLVGEPGPVTGQMLYDGALLNSHVFGPSAVPQTFIASNVVGAAPAGFTDEMISSTKFGSGNETLGYTQQFKGIAVSEPGALAILGAGLVGLGLVRRRRP